MTGAPTHTVMLALLMISAGAMLTMAAGMSRASQPAARWTGIVFEVTAAAYALKLWNDAAGVLGEPAHFLLLCLSFGCVGWFWLFVRALFEDRRTIRPVLFVPVLAPVALGLVVVYLRPPGAVWLIAAASLIRIALALHILMVVTRSWKGDLVEARRRLRGPFLVVVTLYILAIASLDLWELFIAPVAMFPLVNSVVLAIISLAGAFVFIEAREELFAVESGRPLRAAMGMRAAIGIKAAMGARSQAARAPEARVNASLANGRDRAAMADLERLQTLMRTQQVWREEGLTIASLAIKAGMPETQLRRLISDCLGYRNFPNFVNAHRIAAAKARLADPGDARVTVSAIAYDIGFASLGPFNRAFREETGLSPSEWRRNAMGETSPIPEDA